MSKKYTPTTESFHVNVKKDGVWIEDSSNLNKTKLLKRLSELIKPELNNFSEIRITKLER